MRESGRDAWPRLGREQRCRAAGSGKGGAGTGFTGGPWTHRAEPSVSRAAEAGCDWPGRARRQGTKKLASLPCITEGWRAFILTFFPAVAGTRSTPHGLPAVKNHQNEKTTLNYLLCLCVL